MQCEDLKNKCCLTKEEARLTVISCIDVERKCTQLNVERYEVRYKKRVLL